MLSRRLMPISTESLNIFKRFALVSLLLAVSLLGAPTSAEAKSINALHYVSSLHPHDWASHSGYARSQFSAGWGKISIRGHRCDLRNYILMRDLKNVVHRSSDWCIVQSGVLNDPYTATTIYFVRGRSTSSAVQIDHVVALSNAWSTGAQKLKKATRFSLANDPLNLLAVDGPTNMSKSDSDAADFLPPNQNYECKYVARQLAVKRKYHLWVTASEKSAMISVLNHCPSQALPRK